MDLPKKKSAETYIPQRKNDKKRERERIPPHISIVLWHLGKMYSTVVQFDSLRTLTK
jgi:hypothetical protein